nr:hypothetical protein [uncultured Rhodopila sp.]
MPFDGLLQAYTVDRNRCSIDVLLASYGIEPVPEDVLEQHKAEEVRKNPASLFHRRPALHKLLVLTSCSATIASIALFMSCQMTPPSNAAIAALALVMASFMSMVELVLFTRVKRPASWQETPLDRNRAQTLLPPPVLDLLDRIDEGSSGVKFVVGTLYQEHVALDPYLIAEKYDHDSKTTTRSCLAIWDGDQIISIAKQA